MNTPLVSVICICYNHAPYVEEALRSVKSQTYLNVELIVVDDCSTDGSADIIRKIVEADPSIQFIALERNAGNCAAFNRGLKKINGQFVIDLSADDVLLPHRIEKGVVFFQGKDEKYGVNFSDADLIDAEGVHLSFHSDRFPHSSVPQGDVYKEILLQYFINSPTMMMRRSVIDHLGGYDESLFYEDFDFWVRSSRDFLYGYTPEVLIKRRILDSSLGARQYQRGSKQMMSTFKVCEKANALNRTDDERKALIYRVRYEMRRALLLGELRVMAKYLGLLKVLKKS